MNFVMENFEYIKIYVYIDVDIESLEFFRKVS